MGLSPRFFETGAQFAGADYFIPLGSVLSNLSYVTSGLGVSVLATGTRVRGFKPGRSRRIFRAEKILSTPVKDPKMAWKSSFRLNLPDNILAHSSTLRY